MLKCAQHTGMSSMAYRKYDVVIVGAGAAGASLALRLAGQRRVALLSKGPLLGGSTRWAQGGMAAALDANDNPTLHADDTHRAGAGLCNPKAVTLATQAAPAMVRWLAELGVAFDKDPHGHWHLGQEGGHQKRRIVHAGDATGLAIASTLIEHVKQTNTHTYAHTIAIDLIEHQGQCVGLYALDTQRGEVDTFAAPAVVLATGGASHVYGISTNHDCSSGDGMAMAERIGAPISHMAFNQFHPTCLYHPQERSFLISEALRGEGAVLRNAAGERFMQQAHPDAELAPRDVVARAIDAAIKASGHPHVYLDISHQDAAVIRNHFPNIHAKCLSLGIDITREAIPVVPAAHYTCGGVLSDCHGRSGLPGLYAIGEVACTGLHGANRLASNSLLECLVFAKQAASHLLEHPNPAPPPLPHWDASRVKPSREQVIVRHHWHAIQQWMWDYVGIVRSHARLQHALEHIRLHQRDIQRYYEACTVTRDLIELRNLAQVAELIILSAMRQKHNVGLHYNADHAGG